VCFRSQDRRTFSSCTPQNQHVASKIPLFHRPFTSRLPPDAIPLQPLPSLATNLPGDNFGTLPPQHSRQVINSYTPDRHYDSGYTSHQHNARPSSTNSAKSPSTPGLHVTHTEQPGHSQLDVDGDASYTKKTMPWGLWWRRMVLKFFVEWWMLEILSLCFSTVCMVAIICILIIHDGHSIPNLPRGVTINGLIAVFSNFAKSSLLLSTQEALGQLKWSRLTLSTLLGDLLLTYIYRLVLGRLTALDGFRTDRQGKQGSMGGVSPVDSTERNVGVNKRPSVIS
jgi:hypothetical protein